MQVAAAEEPLVIVGGSGIYITQSGSFQVINATVLDASGVAYTAGSGIYLSDGGTKFNLFQLPMVVSILLTAVQLL